MQSQHWPPKQQSSKCSSSTTFDQAELMLADGVRPCLQHLGGWMERKTKAVHPAVLLRLIGHLAARTQHSP